MIVLVLGGTRSGKSAVAEAIVDELAAADGKITYVATAWVDPGDADHVARIEAHRERRPASWATVECRSAEDLPAALAEVTGPILVDSLGTWLTSDPDLAPDVDLLVAALVERDGPTVLVSEEVGLAVHPPSQVGRRYVDAMGSLNQRVAAVADRAVLVVAGRTLELG